MAKAENIEQSPFFERRAAAGQVVVYEPPKFDLENYISHYRGRTYLDRLSVIGITSTYLALDALRLAITAAKREQDVERYSNLMQWLKDMLLPDDPEGVLDTDWVDSRTKQVKAKTNELEQELKRYKNNLIKESIRMGNKDLGAFYYSIGELGASHKAYSRMRDYCTQPKHVAEMFVKLILVAIAQRSWMTVQSHFQKVRQLSLRDEDRTRLEPGLWACAGLALMASQNYRNAADAFLNMRAAYLSSEPVCDVAFDREVMTGNDVAVYGGLCALASMDRAELQSRVLSSSEFRQFLELEPHVRRAISLFCASKYSACLEVLEEYRNDWLLDVYLQPLLEELFELVRSKSLKQYFVPFSSVELSDLEKAFPPRKLARDNNRAVNSAGADKGMDSGTEGDGNGRSAAIEEDLVEMISRGYLDGRLDLVDRLLVSPSITQRDALYTQALANAKSYEKALQLRLFRLSMQNAELGVKASKSGAGAAGFGTGMESVLMPAAYEGFAAQNDVDDVNPIADDFGMAIDDD